MQVSVVIPVYNAEKFLEKAVESALEQPETAEVLLVEDCSPDGSLEICQRLQATHSKVTLLRHPDGKNHGAGASRNLGIRHAQCEFIAFLDADDFYLPKRFEFAARLFLDETIDGVYEAIGIHFLDAEGEKRWMGQEGTTLTTVKGRPAPEQLFNHLIGYNGHIHLDGLVIRKKIIEKSGYFPENLKLHQDTAFIFQLAANGRLVAGSLDSPVALRGVHEDNRFTQNKNQFKSRYLLWETLFTWAWEHRLNFGKQVLLYRKNLETAYQLAKRDQHPHFRSFPEGQLLATKFFQHPLLFIAAWTSLLLTRFTS